MRRRTTVLLIALAVLLAVTASVAMAQEDQYVRGEPEISVFHPDPIVTVGTTDELRLQIVNDGDVRAGAVSQRGMVTDARAVRVDVDDEGTPFDVTTDRQSIGTVRDGEVVDAPFTVTIPDDVEPGTYSMDVRVRYSHTFQFAPTSNVVQERTRTARTSIDVAVEERPRFEISTVERDVQIGGEGTLVTNVTNVGSAPARDVRVRLESESGDVRFGDATANTARIEALEPDESAQVAFRTAVGESVDHRTFSIDGTVHYIDSDGIEHTQSGLSTGFHPTEEQVIAISVDASTLRVGEIGTIEGTVSNHGPADIDDVVLVLGEARFDARSGTYAVGSLERGEVAPFRFRGTVPTDADAVPQRIDVTTQYRTAGGTDRTTTDPIRVAVAERRDAISITAEDPTFVAGEHGTLEVAVTNQRDVELRDIRLTLGVEDPLDSDFRTTIVPRLAPGETDTVAYDLEIDSDAPVSRYPATVEIEYTDPDNEPMAARSATVAVDVTAANGDVVPAIEIVLFVIIAILVAAVFVWLYRR